MAIKQHNKEGWFHSPPPTSSSDFSITTDDDNDGSLRINSDMSISLKSEKKFKEILKYNKDDVYQFGTISVVSLSEVKFKARQLGFVVTLGSRNSRVVERIGFGLKKPMRRDLRDHSFPHEPVTLFTFNMHSDGFFHAGRKNKMNISICNEMINNYVARGYGYVQSISS